MTIGSSSDKQSSFEIFSVEKICTIFSNNEAFFITKEMIFE
jgi:hypothetical protein